MIHLLNCLKILILYYLSLKSATKTFLTKVFLVLLNKIILLKLVFLLSQLDIHDRVRTSNSNKIMTKNSLVTTSCLATGILNPWVATYTPLVARNGKEGFVCKLSNINTIFYKKIKKINEIPKTFLKLVLNINRNKKATIYNM